MDCSSTSSETKQSLTAASATEAASESSPVAAGGDADSIASWQLEAFGTWRTLSDTESAQIEKAYCDPNNDTVSVSVMVCMLRLIDSVTVSVVHSRDARWFFLKLVGAKFGGPP